MKNRFLALLLLSFLVHALQAQSETLQQQEDLTRKSRIRPADYTLGYKPAPFKLKQLKRPADDLRFKSTGVLPSAFDLRTSGRVSPPKDQGGGEYGGNCTSFASIGALESRWLSIGLEEFDLSEQNMAACNGFDEENWGYGQGANQFICSAYLTRLVGPVLEEDDPYNQALHVCRSDIVELEPVALIPEARWLPVRDFERLKRTIYYYGGVYAGIHWDVTGASFRDSDNTYYYNGSEDPNHAVLVCGWDDDMETAGGTGAWIVKNSWGTEWADGGFFYIAYQDTKFADDELAFFPERWETDDIDTAYMYDRLGFTAKLPAINASKVYELARFSAPEVQWITRVGVCVPDPETVLDIHIYGSFNGDVLSDPMDSLENLFIEVPGIYTFELPVMVNGEFYVRVAREIGADTVNHAVETFDEGFSDPVIEPDVNWVRREGAAEWTPCDVAGFGLDFNLTIRAYARTTEAPLASFRADKREACLGSEVTFTYLENNPATTYQWDFGQDASPPSADDPGPHKVTYSTEGTKTISLIVSGAGGADTVIRYDYIDVIPDIRVNLLRSKVAFQQGRSVEITAYGADSYEWSPASLVNTTSGQTVTVTPPFEGTHMLTVAGSQGSCMDTASIEILTTPKPENDDMCDAELIVQGGWIGAYSNEFASAEEGEPAPEDIDCTGELTWCVDDWGPTVTNSLWFYFYGPANGVVSIRTTGFDNQIAVYRAEDCENIIIDSLVRANDDASETEFEAVIDALQVEPGAKYYLQVDGSFGGVKGTFNLIFWDYPTGVQDPEGYDPHASILSVYPNPGEAVFNVRLQQAGASRIQVILYTVSGQMLQRKEFEGVNGELFTRMDLGDYPPGIYHLRVIDGNTISDRKLVKE